MLVGKPYVVDHRDVAVLENHLHCHLVHTVGRRHCVAAGVRHADGLEHALKDAVLAVCAVKHRDDHVDGCIDVVSAEKFCLCAVEVEVAELRTHVDFFAFFYKGLHVAVVLYVEKCVAGHPTALLRDVYWYDVVFVAVHCVHCL